MSGVGRWKLDEPGEEETEAAAQALARSVDGPVEVLSPRARVTRRCPPPAIRDVRLGVHHVVIVAAVDVAAKRPPTRDRGTLGPGRRHLGDTTRDVPRHDGSTSAAVDSPVPNRGRSEALRNWRFTGVTDAAAAIATPQAVSHQRCLAVHGRP